MDSPGRRQFKARLSEFDEIAAYIESACATLQEDARLRIVLLVEELFVNSVNHGYGADSDEPVWLTLSVNSDECHLVYEDCAPAYDPFATVDTAASTNGDVDQRRVGGLGIVLLVEFSTQHGYQRTDGRNVIELHVPHDRRL